LRVRRPPAERTRAVSFIAAARIREVPKAQHDIKAAWFERQIDCAAVVPFDLRIASRDPEYSSLRSSPVIAHNFPGTKLTRLATSPVPQATSSTRSASRQPAREFKSSRPGPHDFVCKARTGRGCVASELPSAIHQCSPIFSFIQIVVPMARRSSLTPPGG